MLKRVTTISQGLKQVAMIIAFEIAMISDLKMRTLKPLSQALHSLKLDLIEIL
jgi:hypothetical protein